MLTAVIPTRNRSLGVIRQLRLFADSGFPYPVIVADSSDEAEAALVRDAAAGRAGYRRFPPETGFYGKLMTMAEAVTTPFILLAPDRKATLPHSVSPALDLFRRRPECVLVQGYVLGFEERGTTTDINRVINFTPSIDDDDPLRRHYRLMQRWQTWSFAVARTSTIAVAAAHANAVVGAVFQELSFVNAMVLQGTFARTREIMTLQSTERSLNPLTRVDPLYWFLDDSRSFFRHFSEYLDALERFVNDRHVPMQGRVDLPQLLDTIHAVWLRRSFDDGVLNYAARYDLGEPIPPTPNPDPRVPWSDPAPNDIVHETPARRRYVWRSSVLNAEPRDEILITPEEIERVEPELTAYFNDEADMPAQQIPSDTAHPG